jgi:hypothetical protein
MTLCNEKLWGILRIIIFTLIIFLYLFILAQSWFASPRGLAIVFMDTWEMLIFVIPLSFVVLRMKVRNLLVFGVAYFIVGFWVGFLGLTLIKIEYATLSFLMAIFFTGEWFNYRKFGKSLLSELFKGNYYLAIGLFLSTVVLGSIVEFLNAPGGLWLYRWPFPSITIFGVPVFTAAFGWFPWILAMFVFLYPFAMKRPKKLASRSRV